MPAFFKKANAMLLSLKADFPHIKAVVPSRLQTYMSSGKPILGMIDGGAADLINEANCGYAVNAGDYKLLADIIGNKILTSKEEFSGLGENGRRYFEKNFTLDTCMNNLEEIINKVD